MADAITVSERSDGAFDVEVRHPRGVTRHVVTVPAGLAASVGAPDAEPALIVHRSFGFLLEREPATSILARFSLDVIGGYFPEYPAELSKLLHH